MPRSVGSSSGWTAGAGDVVAAADEVLAGAGFDDDPHPQATNRTATPVSAAAISRGRIGTETTGTARPPSSGTVEPGLKLYCASASRGRGWRMLSDITAATAHRPPARNQASW